MPTMVDIVEAQRVLGTLLYSHWLSQELFSFSWFMIVIPMVLLPAIFVVLVDKSRLRELILYGTILATAYAYVYSIANALTLWQYLNNFIPYTLNLVPFAFVFHPILHILAYQYSSSWKGFAIANTVAAALFAFVALPIYAWLNVIEFYHWNYLYSFILAWGISFIARSVVIWLANIEQKHATRQNRASLSPSLQPAMKMFEDDENES